ncbi:MAG TPA: methyltransferase [Dongiaceae bacterium]|nr:methyltransferase [Dongiaceae bacterium]
MQPPAGVADMRRLLLGFSTTIGISAVAELGIADHLAERPRTATELAQLTGTNEEFLRRLLRYLSSEGVFEEGDGDLFALTERSHWLRSEIPGSIRARAIYTGSAMSWMAWGSMMECLKTGKSGFLAAFGQDIFDHIREHPKSAATFNAFMAAQTAASGAAILNAYSFAGVREMVDVGGGHGSLIAAVLRAHAGMRGILFDMPEVIATAGPALEKAGVADRCRTVSGDFFSASVPAGADLYALKFILHDWPDDKCVAILRNCRKAMAPGGKVLIVEFVVPEGRGPHVSKFMDINMMVNTSGGRERTEQQFAQLLAAAGLRLQRIVPTAIELNLLECVAADA